MKRSIWLTGDVHHMSMHGSDQVLLKKNGINKTEVELCEPYLEISNHYGFKPTLFFSGKSIKEEVEKVQELVSKYTFSIGGHTYSTYQPIILSKISGSSCPSESIIIIIFFSLFSLIWEMYFKPIAIAL